MKRTCTGKKIFSETTKTLNLPIFSYIYVLDLLKLKGFVAERQGERDEMNDRHVIIENFLELIKEPSNEM